MSEVSGNDKDEGSNKVVELQVVETVVEEMENNNAEEIAESNITVPMECNTNADNSTVNTVELGIVETVVGEKKINNAEESTDDKIGKDSANTGAVVDGENNKVIEMKVAETSVEEITDGNIGTDSADTAAVADGENNKVIQMKVAESIKLNSSDTAIPNNGGTTKVTDDRGTSKVMELKVTESVVLNSTNTQQQKRDNTEESTQGTSNMTKKRVGSLKNDQLDNTQPSESLSQISNTGSAKKKRRRTRKRGPKNLTVYEDNPTTISLPLSLTNQPSYNLRMKNFKMEIQPLFAQWHSNFHDTPISLNYDLRYVLPDKSSFFLNQWGSLQYHGLSKKDTLRHGFQVIIHNKRAILENIISLPSLHEYASFFLIDKVERMASSRDASNRQAMNRFLHEVFDHDNTLFISFVIIRKIEKDFQRPILISSSLWTPLLTEEGYVTEWFLHRIHTSNELFSVDIMGNKMSELSNLIPFRGQGLFKLHLRVANAISPCSILSTAIPNTSENQCLYEHDFIHVEDVNTKHLWTQEEEVTIGIHGSKYQNKSSPLRDLFLLQNAGSIEVEIRMDMKWIQDLINIYTKYNKSSTVLTPYEMGYTEWNENESFYMGVDEGFFHFGEFLRILLDNIYFDKKGNSAIINADKEQIKNMFVPMLGEFFCDIIAQVQIKPNGQESNIIFRCLQCHRNILVKNFKICNWLLPTMDFLTQHYCRSCEDRNKLCTEDMLRHAEYKTTMHALKTEYYGGMGVIIEEFIELAIIHFDRFKHRIHAFINAMMVHLNKDVPLIGKQYDALCQAVHGEYETSLEQPSTTTTTLKNQSREPSNPGMKSSRYFLGENCDFFHQWKSIAYCRPFDLKGKDPAKSKIKRNLCLFGKGIPFSKPQLQVWMGYSERKKEALWIDYAWMTDENIEGISNNLQNKCVRKPNTIFPLDTQSLANLQAIHQEAMNYFIAHIKYIPRSTSIEASKRSYKDYQNEQKEWICYAPNKKEWLMESKGYMIGQNSFLVEERLGKDWVQGNIDSKIIKKAKASPKLWIQVPVGASEKQTNRDNKKNPDTTALPTSVEMQNKCAPMPMAKMLFHRQEIPTALVLQQQAKNWQSIDKVTQIMTDRGFVIQSFDTSTWNILRNKHKYFILLRLIDSYGDTQHAITVYGNEYADANKPSILHLNLANLNESCGYKKGECDNRYVGFVEAVALKKPTI